MSQNQEFFNKVRFSLCKDRDKTITSWVKFMKIAPTFHKIDRNNSIEFLKTLFIGIIAQYFMGLKDTSKHSILYGENNNPNENPGQILNRFENEIRKEFWGEDWEANFQQEVKRKRMKNLKKLTRFEVCDLCYLRHTHVGSKNYVIKCEFDNDENVVGYYNDLYFKKKSNLLIQDFESVRSRSRSLFNTRICNGGG